jgi:hypothetical protein
LIKAIELEATPRTEADFAPSLNNPAVALCNEVWVKIHHATWEKTRNLCSAARCAGQAYRLALPSLSGYQNICDFIACVGYGILLGAIKPDIGTKLLYAAQVALGAIPRESKTQSRTAASPS